MKRAGLIDLKKRSANEKINFLVDITYDIQERQKAFNKMYESCTIETKTRFKEIDEALYGSHAEPQKGLSPRIIAVEKSRKFWTKLMWVALGSGTGFLIVYLIKALFLSSSAG